MDMVELKRRVEHIIGQAIQEGTVDSTEWRQWTDGKTARPVLKSGRLFLPWREIEGKVTVWEVDANQITEHERGLVELLVATARAEERSSITKGDEESHMMKLGAWLHAQLKNGTLQSEIPEEFTAKSKLTSSAVAILLSGESRISEDMTFNKLSKLLKSYFGGEVVLIPLPEQEWLILAKESLLEGFIEISEEGTEAQRTMLMDLCQGIYELISSEWTGNFHLSVAQPIIPLKSLLTTTLLLRETLLMGKMFNVASHIHLPWRLYLERLIYSIPDHQRQLFIEQTGIGANLFSDAETLTTLETFFQLDCNISETAKRLYIHRNTLLYRMDKIKQETGLDVRSFRDAVLVKLTLLLYKVTKSR